MDSSTFREHFRVAPAVFELIVQRLGPSLLPEGYDPTIPGRPPITPEKTLMITLWILANRESYRSVADRFGVSKSTSWKCVIRTCEALLDLNSRDHIISWPDSARQRRSAVAFERKGFPGAIGAVDGCHIEISAPKESHNSYYNRKGFHSIILQGICDEEKLFIDVYAGEAGSVHDALVFRRSDFFGRLTNGNLDFEGDGHILADNAYPISQHVMKPFSIRDRSHKARRFNLRLSRARVIIEMAFGLLRGRFRRLKYLEIKRIELVSLLIVACCILHNIAILENDWEWVAPEDDPRDQDEDADEQVPVRHRRQADANRDAGQAKRERIAQSFM